MSRTYNYRLNKAKEKARESLELSEIDKARLAMAIDCEGTIGIFKGKRKDLEPRVSIANTGKRLLEFFKEKVKKGSICGDEYCCRYYDVKPLLEAVRPYLILKKGQADLVLEFVNLRLSRERWWNPHTERELQIREEILKLNEKPRLTKRVPSHKEVADHFKEHQIGTMSTMIHPIDDTLDLSFLGIAGE